MKILNFLRFGCCNLALGLALTSCLNTEKEIGTTDKDPRATYTPPAPSERARMTGASVLNTVQGTHIFSDPARPDRFVAQLRGLRVISGQVHLFVLNADGDTLRHDVRPARALLTDEALADPAAACRGETRGRVVINVRASNDCSWQASVGRNSHRIVECAAAPCRVKPASINIDDGKAHAVDRL